MGFKRTRKNIKKRKAVSVLIGYVLLIVFAIVISIGVYSWLKTYVPSTTLSCKDGVSLFIKGSSFNATGARQLNITIKNNGRFNVAAYFIYATNSTNQSLPVLDLSPYLDSSHGGEQFGNAVLFSPLADNSFAPGDQVSHIFNIPYAMGNIYTLQVVPALFQNDSNNRNMFVSCSDDKINQQVGEGAQCIPQCTGKTCGPDGCGGTCSPGCSTGDTCDASGLCFNSITCTPASPATKSAICGSQTCGTALNGTGSTSCGTIFCGDYGGGCQSGFFCNSTNQCQATSTCNGVWSPPESTNVQCDGGTNCLSNCQCPAGYNPDGSGGCVASSGTYSIDDYCKAEGYSFGTCTANNGGCQNQGGVLVSGGNAYCGSSLGCCIP